MNQVNNRIKEIAKNISADTVLIFDMDDTLIHSSYANFLAYQKAIQTIIGNQVELIYDPHQRINRNRLRALLPDLTEDEYASIVQEKERCYNNFLVNTNLDLRISSILLKHSQINRTVLVTNCRKERALTTLAFHGLLEAFSDILFRTEDQFNGLNKYKYAIEQLAVSPNEVVVFENERSEIAGALDAGIPRTNIINL